MNNSKIRNNKIKVRKIKIQSNYFEYDNRVLKINLISIINKMKT